MNPDPTNSHDVIVTLYAETGAWCETARLMYTTITRRATPTEPEKREFRPPSALVRDAEHARAAYLRGALETP